MSSAITLITSILLVVGQWFILEKMGEKGWKAIIPFYGTYLLFKHAWNTKMYWITLGLSCAAFVGGVAGITLTLAGSVPVALVISVAALAAGIAAFVVDVKFMYELCKHFGHGAGYTVGMIFFDPIITLVLGLGKDQFVEA